MNEFKTTAPVYKNLGIDFSENDNNLAIALGGFTEGITTNYFGTLRQINKH